MSGKLPTSWKRGDKFSAGHLNEVVEVARRVAHLAGSGKHISLPNGTAISGEEIDNSDSVIVGVLVNAGPAGEADFTNEMYWVKAAYLVNLPAGDDGTTVASWRADDHYKQHIPYPAKVTNMAEATRHNHGLWPLDGTRAVCFWLDYDDAGNAQWLMDEATVGHGQYQEMFLGQATQNSDPVFKFVLGHGMA